jgi:hypothetical protein
MILHSLQHEALKIAFFFSAFSDLVRWSLSIAFSIPLPRPPDILDCPPFVSRKKTQIRIAEARVVAGWRGLVTCRRAQNH